ncbi:acetate--CoA ligase family protein [Lentibacter sp. XHP0401]|uniref:acetate--CoA ligase family protein n=1 Tax=Lentibacter sp. XHP0401 TaxID=2984334 RepID=UPI0021E95C09|nr:acetate--CoA ligase family protein [Lentibacter sp. XHP0401]MCV2894846.1 acetate--CoA ligase family protein [Lentibacter sp. XHP0401]
MSRDLFRLLNPRAIAVIGGGVWCSSIIKAAEMIGYDGEIFPVHPEGKVIAGRQAVRSLAEWDGPIDAAFIGVNRNATISVVRELRALKAGGAVCFASGFSEAGAELSDGADLQAELVAAAGEMPILGPNCYGFINALEGAAIWPDQHGCKRVERGVAILAQSSNIAINLTMQKRALPIAYVVACGNMAQTSQAQIALALLDDSRVSAIGLHIEGFGDTAEWHALALKAAAKGIPLLALKVGKSEHAQAATVSHTASLAGSHAGANALLKRLGIARVPDIPSFLETLKLLHTVGRLDHPSLATVSCSGGEASLAADTVHGRALRLPPLSAPQRTALFEALGPKVALANPLDYHTYIWRDTARMTDTFAALSGPETGITLAIVDYPHTDASDWICATDAVLGAAKRTGRPYGVVATLPELMPLDVAARFMGSGVVPFMGLTEAITAVEAAAQPSIIAPEAPLAGGALGSAETLSEHASKAELARFGVPVPASLRITSLGSLDTQLANLTFPLVLKAEGMAHKSDSGGVALGLTTPDAVHSAATKMGGTSWLVEEMTIGTVAELLVGVTRDEAHGLLLTLGAGGVMTELLQDTVSMLLPVTAQGIKQALTGLKCAPLLTGYRGKPAANIEAITQVILSVQDYVVAHAPLIGEVEINPLLCTPDRAVAVDALIRKALS